MATWKEELLSRWNKMDAESINKECSDLLKANNMLLVAGWIASEQYESENEAIVNLRDEILTGLKED